MSKKKKHTHKYHKVECFGTKLFFCALPGCPHHMPKYYENGLIGKFSICWGCEKEFILDERAMQMDMPTCINCVLPGEFVNAGNIIDDVKDPNDL